MTIPPSGFHAPRTLVPWRKVVLFKISGGSLQSEAREHVRKITGIPSILDCDQDRLHLLLEADGMKFKSKEAAQYVHAEWLKLLEEGSRVVALIERNPPRLQLRKTVHAIALGDVQSKAIRSYVDFLENVPGPT